MNQEIISFLKMALECSVLVDPIDPGLTLPELGEVGNRAGYQEGELNDAFPFVTTTYYGGGSFSPTREKPSRGSSYFRKTQNIGTSARSISSFRN
jgi:hypothetical protein